jgi:hypothetical protein
METPPHPPNCFCTFLLYSSPQAVRRSQPRVRVLEGQLSDRAARGAQRGPHQWDGGPRGSRHHCRLPGGRRPYGEQGT